jgi:diguanylate cyclase
VQEPAHFASKRREYGLRFVGRVYPARIVGLALGGIAVASVLWSNGAHPVAWLALWVSALVWPHVAYGFGVNSADPYRTELRCLLADSVIGGVFIALMKFNLLPSALLVVMLSMDKLSVGGLKFLAPCTAALVVACLAVSFAIGFPARMETSMFEIYGSLPLLVVYPLVVGWTSYRMARQLLYQNKQLEAMSSTDGLSQMFTRQSWERAVAEEFELCKRTGLASSLLLLDIDNLQGFNERYGYPTGDEVIRSVAVTLRNTLREQDVPGRYGGEEFAALLSGADASRALQIGEAVRKAVASSVLERSTRLHGTVSVGVATMDARDNGYRDWISRADQALNAAKAKGGNQTEVRLPAAAAAAPAASA